MSGAAWLINASQRLRKIPWKSIKTESLDQAFRVGKTLCFVHVVNSYVVGVEFMTGPSMLPTINRSGDVIAVERVSALRGRIGIGDVVVLTSPEDPRVKLAKRVMGLEGDVVTISVEPENGDAKMSVVVPKGHVWVQGDNIYESRDSRQFGPVSYGLIQGRLFCRVWPPKAFGLLGNTA